MRRKPTILVVDDEKQIRELFHRLLKKEGYRVLTANNGNEGLKLIDTEKPELVLLDLKLPDMSGIQFLRLIKRRNEKAEVIIITGYGTMKTARIAMRLGAYDYITKPFDVNYIKAVTKDALSPDSDALLQEGGGGGKELLKESLAVQKPDTTSHCWQKKSSVWEVAVKAVVLGQDDVAVDWMEDPNVPQSEKVKLMELARTIKSRMTKQ